jgi:hypothetical protein
MVTEIARLKKRAAQNSRDLPRVFYYCILAARFERDHRRSPALATNLNIKSFWHSLSERCRL